MIVTAETKIMLYDGTEIAAIDLEDNMSLLGVTGLTKQGYRFTHSHLISVQEVYNSYIRVTAQYRSNVMTDDNTKFLTDDGWKYVLPSKEPCIDFKNNLLMAPPAIDKTEVYERSHYAGEDAWIKWLLRSVEVFDRRLPMIEIKTSTKNCAANGFLIGD